MFTAKKFWAKVRKTTKCWLWTGATNGRYGLTHRNGKRAKAHRVAFELTKGPIPKGLGVLHSCDNTLCVRPGHLFLGTQKVNAADTMRKGRATYAKLTFAAAKIIRRELTSGTRGSVLAERFGVCRSAITAVKQGLTFKAAA